MKKLLDENYKNTDGFAALWSIMAVGVILLLTIFVSEYMYMYTVKLRFEDEICQALRSLVEDRTSDMYRSDGIALIEKSDAERDFLKRLYENATLNSEGEFCVDGKSIYKYDQTEAEIKDDSIFAQGTLSIKPLFVGDIFNLKLQIKVSGRVSQIRID